MSPEKKKIIKVVDIVASSKSSGRIRASKPKDEEREDFLIDEMKASTLKDMEVSKKSVFDETEEFIIEEPKKKKRKKPFKWALALIAIVVLLGIGLVANAVLPKVDLHIYTKKVPWEFNDSIVVNKNLNQIDLDSKQIPGQVISQPVNKSFSFTATGKKASDNKARGIITVVNAFGPEQKLVATTRFKTSDGKIFRLISGITVPAAKTVNGKIEPSSIDAQVIADKAGNDYLIGPQSKFTIPGFEGTPKFDGFYGKSDKAMIMDSGLVASSDDISKAQDDAVSQLKDLALTKVLANIPSGFTFATGTANFIVNKKTVDTGLNSQNQFSVFVDGNISLMIYKEDDISSLMTQLAQKDKVPLDYAAQSKDFNPSSAQADWKNFKVTIPLQYKTIFSAPLNQANLKSQVAGKNEIDLKSYIMAIPGVDKLNISFWPFWVGSVPKNQDRINVTIE